MTEKTELTMCEWCKDKAATKSYEIRVEQEVEYTNLATGETERDHLHDDIAQEGYICDECFLPPVHMDG